MGAEAILSRLAEHGLKLAVKRGQLFAEPKSLLNDETRALIREHKPEILAALAREAEDLREHFEERAGILEHDGGLPKPEAELEAARITSTYARNQGYLWESLRAAMSEYPALASQLPAKPLYP